MRKWQRISTINWFLGMLTEMTNKKCEYEEIEEDLFVLKIEGNVASTQVNGARNFENLVNDLWLYQSAITPKKERLPF